MITDEEFKEIKDKIEFIESRLAKLENEFQKISNQPTVQIKKISGIEINVGELPFIKTLKSVADKCLGLLNYVFEKDPTNLGLTPDEMVSIFREKFGLPIPLSTISSQLLPLTGKYVTRTKVVEKIIKYRYQILPRGQEYIRKQIEQLNKV